MKSNYETLPIKYVVDLLSDVRSQAQELSIDAMKNRLQEVALPWILRVEQVEQSQHELAVDVALRNIWLKVGRFEKAQEQLVDNLKMRPR